MAGELEEPISISFQADSLHSGSISFGRFESEELSWERRSSFSHNRYIEEVEKYSKPGSVIEKKAYFEAHFKKKGILLPGSPEGYNQRVRQTSENEDHREEYESINQSTNCTLFCGKAWENADYGEFNKGNERSQSLNIHGNTACFDESPEDSEHHGECEVTEYYREDISVVSSECQKEAALDNINVSMEGVLEDVIPEEAHQTKTGSDKFLLDNDRQEIEIKESPSDNASNVDDSSGPIDPSPKHEIDSKDAKAGAGHCENLASKLRAPVESKSVKPKLKSKTNSSQMLKTLCDASKPVVKNQIGKARNSPLRTKSEKQSQKIATPTRHSLIGTAKREGSENCNSRLQHRNKGDKELQLKKVTESQTSGSKKVEHGACKSTNRLKHTVTKPETRLSAATFNFKSEERAERRKEFFTKLEEKMHAKEAEINQIQAKTQEKVEAEIKKFRKSLNFKATPMPSFYHTPAPPGLDRNKVESKTKPVKARRKSISPGTGAAAGSQLLSKSGNDQASSASESVKGTDLPESSETIDSPSESHEACETLTRNNTPVTKTSVASKFQQKRKDANLQKHQVSDRSTRVSKEKKVESKPKVRNHGNSSETVRRSMKNMGISSNSGMAHLPVGVAS